MVNLSLAVSYAFGGMNVWGYHVFNLIIHLLAALTLYGIVRRTLLRPALREKFGVSGEWIALTVAILWTVHPLQTEAVTYISQRCESLMGLFYLLTLYTFIRGVESRKSAGWFSLSIATCYLGVASKEVMVTAPLMVLLYDRTLVSGNFREAWTRHQRLYLGLASSWLLLGYLMMGLHDRNVGYGLGSTWWGYGLTECRAIVHYLRLAVLPYPLVLDYGPYMSTSLGAIVPYAIIVAVLGIGVLCALGRRTIIGFVGAWFFVILAPTSSVIPIAGSPMAEHRMYLPLVSVIIAIIFGAVFLGERLIQPRQRVYLGSVAGGFVMVLFVLLTIQRDRDYRSALTIWQDTIDKCPNNSRAFNNLGAALFEVGKVRDAIGYLERAVEIKPDYVNAHRNLGIALVKFGNVREGIEQYREVLRMDPDYAEVHDDLGTALEQAGQIDEAIGQYEEALRIKPDYAFAHNDLAVTLARQGRVQEAIEHWRQALRTNPDYAFAHFNLAIALTGQHKLQEAIDHYKEALRIDPDYAEAQRALVRLQAAQ